jgi:hypothetical protein
MNWDVDYPNNKFKPPKDYKLEAVDTDKNWVVEREHLQDCEYLSKLIASFEEARGKICIAHLEAEGRRWLSGFAYRLGKKMAKQST